MLTDHIVKQSDLNKHHIVNENVIMSPVVGADEMEGEKKKIKDKNKNKESWKNGT